MDNVLINSNVLLVSIPTNKMHRLVEIMDRFGLDFDDAYQYVAAEIEKATIVSFDKDFDKTEQGRLPPIQVLQLRN